MRSFSSVPAPVNLFDESVRQSLASLYEELQSVDCYVREHEVVNLFTFGHFVPALQRENLDIRQIGIEYPVRQYPQNEAEKPRVRKDLVIWADVGQTIWNGHDPLGVIEWKNTSLITPRPRDVEIGHKGDIDWLMRNSALMGVGYAVHVIRAATELSMNIVRVRNGSVTHSYALPMANGAIASVGDADGTSVHKL